MFGRILPRFELPLIGRGPGAEGCISPIGLDLFHRRHRKVPSEWGRLTIHPEVVDLLSNRLSEIPHSGDTCCVVGTFSPICKVENSGC